MKKVNILVTGGAGYIGSHTVQALVKSGFLVTVLDNLSKGKRSNLNSNTCFIEADLENVQTVDRIFAEGTFDAVIHFAGSIDAADSVRNPELYYRNNVLNTLSLLKICVAHKIHRFIFSSTAAVYGLTEQVPISEDAPLFPISPYGHSKRMVEQILENFSLAYDFNFIALRYFNVAGSNPHALVGPAQPSRDLISTCSRVAWGLQPKLTIFGDGTSIRDFIHPDDLAKAHVLSLEYLMQNKNNKIYNCGYGKGFSVLEIVQTMRRLNGKEFPIDFVQAREGDPVKSIADSTKIQRELGWNFQYNELEKLLQTSLCWAKQLEYPTCPIQSYPTHDLT